MSSGDQARQEMGSACSAKTCSRVKPVCEAQHSLVGRKRYFEGLIRTETFQTMAVLSLPAVARYLPSCENSSLQISSV